MIIDLDIKEIQLILNLMSYSDPTGFYAKAVLDKIKDQADEQLEVEIKEAEEEGVIMGGSSATFIYDQTTSRLINGNNVAGVQTSTSYPKIFRNNEHAIIRGTIYSDASTTTVANLEALTWSAKIGTVGETALIVNSNSASFNMTSDWTDANVSAGKICFAINTAGSAIDTELASLGSKRLACNINGNDVEGDDVTIAQFDVTLVNTPDLGAIMGALGSFIEKHLVWVIVTLFTIGVFAGTVRMLSEDVKYIADSSKENKERIIEVDKRIEKSLASIKNIEEDIGEIKEDIGEIKKLLFKPVIGGDNGREQKVAKRP